MGETLEPAPSEMELALLEAHEQTIAAGLGEWLDVAMALAAIRRGKLYRADHKSFNNYCQERWDFESAYARRLTAASEVVEVISKTAPMGAVSERALRPLTPLLDKPKELLAAWKEAAADAIDEGRALPTEVHTKAAAAKRRRPAKSPPKSAPKSINFETATFDELVSLGQRRLMAVQKKIREALLRAR